MHTLHLENLAYADGTFHGQRSAREPLSERLFRAILSVSKPNFVITAEHGRIPLAAPDDSQGQYLEGLRVSRGGDGVYRASGTLHVPDGEGYASRSFSATFENLETRERLITFAPFTK